MLGRLSDSAILVLAFVFVVIAWRSSLGPMNSGSADASANVPRLAVNDGTTLGASQPLVAVPAGSEPDLLPTSPQIAVAQPVPAAEFAVNFDDERSLLVSSRVDHAAGELATDAAVDSPMAGGGRVTLVSFVPEPEQSTPAQRGRAAREEEHEVHEEGEEGEEHEEEGPPNSVGQGNAQTQPDLAAMMKTPDGSGAVEQTTMGEKPAPEIVASVDGLGVGFVGPQGRSRGGNPSDNSLAVGPDHIVVTVNSQMAVLTKKGRKYNETGKVLYGPVNTSNVFRDCGNCERNNGDAVVRYDQLADRWLIVMPLFSRSPARPEGDPEPAKSGEPPHESRPGREGQPGPAVAMFQPPALTPEQLAEQEAERGRGRGQARRGRGQGGGRRGAGDGPRGSYGMCYAISTTSDPLGSYYRYEFVRALFPDYPRPAVWPDGYYVPTSTGDNVIEKHACVVERDAMLRGEPAREQCAIIGDVNFLNNADLDGFELPPPGAPNILIAAGGSQLNQDLDDDAVYAWKMSVNWDDPTKTKVEGPEKIAVAPYNYLCGGQLTRCVPQQGSDTRLDAQGDKIMARLVYRRIGDQESIVGVHSINTTAGGGGVRWYEFRIDGADRNVKLYQQGTYTPGGDYRWMASPAIDKFGNIGIGYSYGGANKFPGQRFAGRQPNDPLGRLTLKEAVLIEGQAAQEGATRWQDYVQTAVDPSDDCTIWYVGDYVKEGQTRYSSRVGAFRLPGCE